VRSTKKRDGEKAPEGGRTHKNPQTTDQYVGVDVPGGEGKNAIAGNDSVEIAYYQGVIFQ
jgi:hypothetical protein